MEDEELQTSNEGGQEPHSGEEIAAFERYIAGRFQDQLLSENTWNSGVSLAGGANRQLAQRLHDEYPGLDPTAVEQAKQQVSSLLEPPEVTERSRSGGFASLALSLAVILGSIGVIGVATVWSFSVGRCFEQRASQW